MTVKFEDLNLHDSEILAISVKYLETDRKQIELVLDYVENYDQLRTSRKTLCFLDCYKVKLELNLDIVAPESILDGSVVKSSSDVSQIAAKLEKIGGSVPESLTHYRIETSSSGGTIDILSTGFSLLDSGEP